MTPRFPIDPAAWRPPKAPPPTGMYARNDALAGAEQWPVPDGRGPEDVAVDSAGRVYAGAEDGRILRWPAGGGPPEVIADTGGWPLGIEIDRDGSVVVCDARKGLLRVDDGRVEVLVDAFGLRKLVVRLPEWTQPQPKDHAYVIAVDARGEVVANLQDPDGWLYLGSLTHPAVARVRLQAVSPG